MTGPIAPKRSARSTLWRDPLPKLQMRLLRDGILDAEAINRLEQAVDEEVTEAAEKALRAPDPGDPTRSPGMSTPRIWIRPAIASRTRRPRRRMRTERTMADLINLCLRDEMRRDPRIVVFGQDVADCSREEYLKQDW